MFHIKDPKPVPIFRQQRTFLNISNSYNYRKYLKIMQVFGCSKKITLLWLLQVCQKNCHKQHFGNNLVKMYQFRSKIFVLMQHLRLPVAMLVPKCNRCIVKLTYYNNWKILYVNEWFDLIFSFILFCQIMILHIDLFLII